MVASRRRRRPRQPRRLALPERIERLDERVATRINGRRTEPGVDAFWRGLSTVANHGVLWFAVAAVLIGSGKQRAAVRGLASLGVASAVANLVGKQLVGGERPATTSIPITRRLDRSPTSPSFPSGHTASAAAFATGVALESPALGAVVAPLAAGVAYSRLHTGAHWFSDVVGGALIGAGAAVLGRGLAAARRKVADARIETPTTRTIQLPALADGTGAFILVNPHSGRDLGRLDPMPRLRERVPGAVLHELADGDHIGELVEAALASATPPAVLGVYGGDGSVATVAGLARRHDLPVLALPGGTFNHFARAADLDTLDAAIDALVAGTGRAVDVGELTFADGEPMTVLNTASVGLYPAFVEEREKREKRFGKPLAAAIAALRVVRGTQPLVATVTGGSARDRADRAERIWTVFVGIGRYYPSTVAPIERRRLDDGVLDVRILRAENKPRTRGALALILGGRANDLLGRMPPLRGAPVVETFTATEVEIVARADDGSDPGYAHDGEASAQTPGGAEGGGYTLRVRLVPGGLRVYSPEA